MEMPIWKDDEIKRAYNNVVYAQTAFNKSPNKQTWGRFCDAYKTWSKLVNKTIINSDDGVMFTDNWIDN